MPTSHSVLSFLATRFTTQPENIATEALCFILSRSEASRRALTGLSQHLGAKITGELTFRTQVSAESGARPDLIGVDESDLVSFVLEAKFWAGLTIRQPVTYLSDLPDSGGIVLFVAPAERIETLWPELMRRIGNSGWPIDHLDALGATGRYARIGQRIIGLTSWRTLLDTMLNASDLAGEAAAGDIRQLIALCEYMDTEAFLPLSSEEITSNLGRRLVQFCTLVDDLADSYAKKRIVDLKGLRATGGHSTYGRYLRIKQRGAFLCFSGKFWASKGDSPIWLRLYGQNFKSVLPPDLEALRTAGIHFYKSKNSCLIPISLLTGVERDGVFADMQTQLEKVFAQLSELAATDGEVTNEPPGNVTEI